MTEKDEPTTGALFLIAVFGIAAALSANALDLVKLAKILLIFTGCFLTFLVVSLWMIERWLG